MAVTHESAAGMGGVRTAGDLVARMVFSGMKLAEAKKYVADKLGCTTFDLSDETAMREIRESLDIGHTVITPHSSYGMAAKFNIAKVLDIEIPCVELFKKQIGR